MNKFLKFLCVSKRVRHWIFHQDASSPKNMFWANSAFWLFSNLATLKLINYLLIPDFFSPQDNKQDE